MFWHLPWQREPERGHQAGFGEDAERFDLCFGKVTGAGTGEADHVSRLKPGNNAILAAGTARPATVTIDFHDTFHAFG